MRHAVVADLRGCLNRVLRVMYTRVGGSAQRLVLAPEPNCLPQRSVAEVTALYQAGVISRDEARELAGQLFGKSFD